MGGAQHSSSSGLGTPPSRRSRAVSGSSDVATGNRSPTKRKRATSFEDNWDFFVSLDENSGTNAPQTQGDMTKGPLSWESPQTHPPVYILEGSLSEQELWHSTAGKRPVQPAEERKYYENLYKSNFENSEALKDTNLFDEPAIEKASRRRKDSNEIVLFRGKGPFSYAVSKSFLGNSPPCMTLQVKFENVFIQSKQVIIKVYLLI